MIAVIGAGIAGLTVARELAGHGFDVALIDRGSIPGDGASAVPLALLNVHRGRTARAHPEDRAGLVAMRRLIADLGMPSGAGVWLDGVLRQPSDSARAERWRTGDGARWIPAPRDAPTPEPVIAPVGLVHFAEGGFVDTRVVRSALLAALPTERVERRPHTRVLAIEPGAADGSILVTTRGDARVTAVVVCTGAEPTAFAPDLPLREVAGEQIAFANDRVAAHPLPLLGTCYAAWLAGHTWVGGNHRAPSTPADDGLRELERSARSLLPDLRGRPVEEHFSGTRGALPDNRPRLVVAAPRRLHLVGLAGRGYLLSALLAHRVLGHLTESARG